MKEYRTTWLDCFACGKCSELIYQLFDFPIDSLASGFQRDASWWICLSLDRRGGWALNEMLDANVTDWQHRYIGNAPSVHRRRNPWILRPKVFSGQLGIQETRQAEISGFSCPSKESKTSSLVAIMIGAIHVWIFGEPSEFLANAEIRKELDIQNYELQLRGLDYRHL